jgi:hypothetical protein
MIIFRIVSLDEKGEYMRTLSIYPWVVLLCMGATQPTRAQVWQEWTARHGGEANGADFAVGIALDGGGNVYVGGEHNIVGLGEDFGIVKYNSAGIEQWVASYGTGYFMEPTDLAADPAGNVWMTGMIFQNWHATEDYLTVKFNSSGALQWAATYNGASDAGDAAHALALDADGNVYVTGASAQPGMLLSMTTVKYDPSGNAVWVAHSPNQSAADNRMGRAIALDAQGNAYVGGHSGNIMSTVKLDDAGQQLWVAFYAGSGSFYDDRVNDLAVDGSSNVYVTGFADEIATYNDYTTIKYDASGNQLWLAQHSGPADYSDDQAQAIAVDDAGNAYVTGFGWNGASGYDVITIKYDAGGQPQWLAQYNGPYNINDYGYDLTLDAEGNVYVAGQSQYQMLLLKYDTNGILLWEDCDVWGCANALTLDDDGQVFATGYGPLPASSSDFVTLKYSQWPIDSLDILLDPIGPYLIPASGGSFDYEVAVSSTFDSTVNGQVWFEVTLPDSSVYGPVVGPAQIVLPPDASLQRLRTQAVPAGAPPGIYFYRGYLGVYPTTIWASAEFTFAKAESGGLDAGFGDQSEGLSGGALRSFGGFGEWAMASEESGQTTSAFITRHSSLITSCSPNPFNPTTTISFSLPEAGKVKLAVFDLQGRPVATLIDGFREAGEYQTTFDANTLTSGVYLARLTSGAFSQTQKLVLMK